MAATDSHLRFALRVHQALGADGGNTCFSPYSVASALSLTERAARGETAGELHALLGDDQAELLKAAAELPGVAGGAPARIGVSNTLWVWDGLPLEDSFKTELAGWPGAGVESAPFVDDPEAARELINADVARATHNLIPQLLSPGSVNEATVAALVNALYLKAGWRHAFEEGATADEDFHAPGGTRRVPTMHLQKRLGHAHTDGWQVVDLPADGGVAATILLPDAPLAEAKLDAATLGRLLSAQRSTEVRLSLPKISLDVRSPLTELLDGLGVRLLFTDDADLTGLSPDERLYVSSVVHQAVLRLDEQGLEGAAATAVVMALASLMSGGPVEMRVDRPFLLLVRHPASGAVYFFARVVEP